MKLIVYTNEVTSDEVLIAAEADEEELLKSFFEEGGRDLDEYERCEFEGSLAVKHNQNVEILGDAVKADCECDCENCP